MVLRSAVGKARGLPEQFAICVFEECEDANASAARRCRHRRSVGPKPGVVSRAETLWRGSGVGRVSARAAWLSRREAPGGSLEPHPRLVRCAPEEITGGLAGIAKPFDAL